LTEFLSRRSYNIFEAHFIVKYPHDSKFTGTNEDLARQALQKVKTVYFPLMRQLRDQIITVQNEI